MSDLINVLDVKPVPQTSDVEIFDPPMCCPTGLCGPLLDQTLLDLNEMIMALQSEGITIARYQMASHFQAFLANSEVMRLIKEKEMAALPITVIRGEVIKSGDYPKLSEIKIFFGEGVSE